MVWLLPERRLLMAQPPLESIFAEPVVIWRLRNDDDGRRALSVIVPHGSKASVGWFCQGLLQESLDFPTWDGALSWLESKSLTLRLNGWHSEDEPKRGRDRDPTS
jgi:hypothetical protein